MRSVTTMMRLVMSSIANHKMELEVFSFLAYRLAVARQKHPDYADGATAAWGVIREELFELLTAIDHESESRQIDEAIDVAVTAIRFILREHKK